MTAGGDLNPQDEKLLCRPSQSLGVTASERYMMVGMLTMMVMMMMIEPNRSTLLSSSRSENDAPNS